MKQIDFEYDGSFLSDFGFIICKFDPTNSISDTTAGSTIVFEKISINNDLA